MASRALSSPTPEKTQGDRRYYARSFGNPVAQLFWREDESLCCGLCGERAELIRRLMHQGLLELLTKNAYLAPFDSVSEAHEDYSLMLRLARVPRISYCHEWSTEMWRAASLHML